MESFNDFESEWKALGAQRKKLSDELDQVKKQELDLCRQSDIAKMLVQKSELEKEVRDLHIVIGDYDQSIYNGQTMVQNCIYVLNDEMPREWLDEKRTKFLERMYKVRQKRVSIGPMTTRFIQDIEKKLPSMTTRDALTYFGQTLLSDQQERQTFQNHALAIQKKLGEYDQSYRQTKHCLRTRAEALQKELEAHDQVMTTWMTVHKPSQPNLPCETPKSMGCKKNHKNHQTTILQPSQQEPETPPKQPWEFFIAHGKHDVGSRVPLNRERFFDEVKQHLDSKVRSLNVSLLHKKLDDAINMDLQQRQSKIKKLKGPEAHGLQRIRIGGYRIVLLIDESLHRITFTPCKKGHETYKKHR